jgi:elongation factor G
VGDVEGVGGQVRRPEEGEPFSGLVFKVVVDPYAGALAWTRVYSGTLRPADRVALAMDGRSARVRGLMKMDAGKREPVESAGPGEIVAIAGLGRVVSSETLHDPSAPIALASIERPEPVVWLGVSPESDAERFGQALGRVLTEDPSLALRVDEETGESVLGGVGELHLEVTLNRLRDELGVGVIAGAPQVAYRVTAGREVEHHLRFKRMNGGPGAFADVTLRVAPGEPGQGVRFVSEVTGQVLPRELQEAVGRGVEDGAERGVLGDPIEDVDVALIGGAFHEVDSSERDFRFCAAKALVEAVEESAPRRLEPMMRLEVVTPEESLGLVMGDLSRRRGRVLGMTHEERAIVVVDARVPLAELFGYADMLRGLSGGRGSYTARPDGREPV